MVADAFPETTLTRVGAAGTATGVTVTAVEATPVPTAFTANILMEYSVPLLKLVITIGLLVEGELRVVQVEPLSIE